MNNLLVALVCLLVVNTACATGAFPSVLGIFMGMADWYEFNVDTSKPLGGAVANYQQNTRLVFTEQQGVCDCARTCFAYSLSTSELILSLLVQTSLSFFFSLSARPFLPRNRVLRRLITAHWLGLRCQSLWHNDSQPQ